MIVLLLFLFGLAASVPANDLCSNATEITDGTTITSNVGGTAQSACISGSDVFLHYTATCNGTALVVFLATGNGDIRAVRFTGNCSALTETGCTNVAPETLSFVVTQGFGYYMAVGAFTNYRGNISVTVTCNLPPVNDVCGGALTIPDGLSQASNAWALFSNAGCTNGTYDVFFKYIPSCTGNVFFSFSTASGLYNLTVAGFSGTGNNGSTCGALGTALGCVNSTNPKPFFAVTENLEFHLVLGTNLSNRGIFNISTLCVPAPENDECLGAATIFDGITQFNNTGAKKDTTCTYASDIFFFYTATCTGTTYFTTDDPTISVFTVPSCASVIPSSCTKNWMEFSTTFNQGYYLGVGTDAAHMGQINVSLQCAIKPANDDCVGAMPIYDGGNNATTVGGKTQCLTGDIYFVYTATCSGFVDFYFSPSTGVQAAGVWTQEDSIVCSSSCPSGLTATSPLEFRMSQGAIYFIVLGVYSGYRWRGPVNVTVQCIPHPVYDTCDGALAMSDGATQVTNRYAVNQTRYINHADVYLLYTATCTGMGLIYFQTPDNFTNSQYALDAVQLQGTSCSNLVERYFLVEYSNDVSLGLCFAVEQGQKYYVAVGSRYGYRGNITVTGNCGQSFLSGFCEVPPVVTASPTAEPIVSSNCVVCEPVDSAFGWVAVGFAGMFFCVALASLAWCFYPREQRPVKVYLATLALCVVRVVQNSFRISAVQSGFGSGYGASAFIAFGMFFELLIVNFSSKKVFHDMFGSGACQWSLTIVALVLTVPILASDLVTNGYNTPVLLVVFVLVNVGWSFGFVCFTGPKRECTPSALLFRFITVAPVAHCICLLVAYAPYQQIALFRGWAAHLAFNFCFLLAVILFHLPYFDLVEKLIESEKAHGTEEATEIVTLPSTSLPSTDGPSPETASSLALGGVASDSEPAGTTTVELSELPSSSSLAPSSTEAAKAVAMAAARERAEKAAAAELEKRAAEERAAAEKAAAEKIAAVRAAEIAENAAAEKVAAVKAAVEKAAAEKAAAEKSAAEKASAEKAALEKAAGERAAEKAASEKAAAERAAAEKVAAERAAFAVAAAPSLGVEADSQSLSSYRLASPSQSSSRRASGFESKTDMPPQEKWSNLQRKFSGVDDLSLEGFQHLKEDEMEETLKSIPIKYRGEFRTLYATKSKEVIVLATNILQIPDKDLVLGELLGEGSFSKVHKAIWTRVSGSRQIKLEVAVKVPKTSKVSEALPPDFQRDLGVMVDLPHQNILIVHGVCLDSPVPRLVCECMDMDLGMAIEAGMFATRSFQLRAFYNISEGIAFLHSKHVVHRDLKPKNVLLRRPDHFKICDFGASKDVTRTLEKPSLVGTEAYLAPEIRARKPTNTRADVWSFGILMYECLTGNVPEVVEGGNRIAVQTIKLLKDLERVHALPHLADIFKQCREEEPNQRPAMAVVAKQLAGLLVQSAHDSQSVKEELKACLRQDLDAYSNLWALYAPRIRDGLSFIKDFAALPGHCPSSVRQPLLSPSSFEDLAALASQAPFIHDRMEQIVLDAGGKYVRGPKKSRHRAVQKVEADYNGDFARLLDFERGAGLSEMEDFFEKCLVGLNNSNEISIVRVKDRMNVPVESGYRDVLLNLKDNSSGFVVELQLVFTRMAELKSQVHRFYELSRQMKLAL